MSASGSARCWVVSDGIAGNRRQAAALAQAMGLDEAWAQREQKVVTREPETLPAYARDFVAYVAAQPLPEEGAVQESLP